MLKKIKDVNINFVQYGNPKKDNVILLHGWGQNIAMMKPLGDALSDDYFITNIDLPGHGNSEEPSFAWQLSDFVEMLEILIKDLKIKDPILVGHSFGGKICLLYASKNPTKKLVLLASPFKKEAKDKSLKQTILKSLKNVPGLNKLEDFAKRHIGSTDYRNASKIMREILVNHVNQDACEDAKKITCPTLLIWGTEDKAVDISRAYELEKLIKNSGLVVYDGATHYAYLERLGQTINVLKSFFSS